MVAITLASTADFSLEKFLHENGTNEWNFLPKDGVHETFETIRKGKGKIVIARESEEVVGIGIYIFPEALPSTWSKYAKGKKAVFVAEMCVHREHVGKGIGSIILGDIARRAATSADLLLMDRHEDNKASAGMMRKAGCELIDVFDDHDKRPTGSRRTAVLQIDLAAIRDPGI